MTRTAVVLALALGACGVSEEDCRQACDRPYELVEGEAATRHEAWQRIPGAPGDQAQAVYDEWRPRFDRSREAWVATCVEGCRELGTSEVIRCRRQAPNVGAWKRCEE